MGALAAGGCGADNPISGAGADICGPCGLVAQGDVGISGNAKLDGFFAAVSQLNNATVSIQADFQAHLNELIAAFGVDVAADATLDAKVTALNAAIKAEITANVQGGLQVNYVPAKCSANVNVAVSAQAQCEAKADCDVMASPGEVSVECSGKCEGKCDAECTGGF
ncbi:MAG TPA: hypothetical protein VGP93_19810, partial [Polyangiaceae bacterium]|nr:hypothetical protein [Polyangiaceae bacterium]